MTPHRLLVLGALFGTMTIRADGQTVSGRVTAESDGAALGSVSVALLLGIDETVRRTVTDEHGVYLLLAPRAGAYRVVAHHLGYHRLESPFVSVADSQTVTIDFELPSDPFEIEGVEVEVQRREELGRRVAQYGVAVDQIGRRFVPRSEIEARPTAINIGQVLQWQNMAGITIDWSNVPPRLCVRAVRLRARCALTLVDGAIIDGEFAVSVPLEVLEAIVILTPVEATLSFGTAGGAGAVLLFTQASVGGR
jgi:hypothetical protein